MRNTALYSVKWRVAIAIAAGLTALAGAAAVESHSPSSQPTGSASWNAPVHGGGGGGLGPASASWN